MPNRRKFSKKKRFAIFARDGFCCRYCGVSSESAKLVVDHIIPICKEGTNDDTNLITACEPCNQGKGGNKIPQTVPTEIDGLRLHQEFRDQEELAELTAAIARQREKTRRDVGSYYADLTGATEINRNHLSTLVNILEDVGPSELFQWMDIAFRNTGQQGTDLVRYVCGIRKRIKEDCEAIH